MSLNILIACRRRVDDVPESATSHLNSGSTPVSSGLLPPDQHQNNKAISKNLKSDNRDMRKRIFQKLRRLPTGKPHKINKSDVSNTAHNGQGNTSKGVTFVEPNYEHQNPAADSRKESLRFDYSSSWQNLKHFKQLTTNDN